MFKYKNAQWPRFILLLIVPLVLWILPSDFFDGEGGIVVCPSRFFFDIECLGCGMTRAVMHLHHLELLDAVYYNAGVVLVYPVLVIIWFLWVKNAYKEIKKTNE